MDDTGASGTRKRPRLDSGRRAQRSMSADRLTSAPPVLDTQQQHGPTVHSSQDQAQHHPPITPTRVTINVRESTTEEASLPTDQSGVTLHGAETHAQAVTHKTSSETPQVTSAQPSRNSSPTIEVAEVENVGDEPSVTRWRPLKSSLPAARQIQAQLLDMFPSVAIHHTWPRSLEQIKVTIERREPSIEVSIDGVAEWIEQYLEVTQDLSQYWWDLLTDEREFWDEFPSILETLMRQPEASKAGLPAMQLTTATHHPQAPDPLTRFLAAWTSLSLRMTEIDLQTLTDTAMETSIPDLISDRFITPLQCLARSDSTQWKHIIDPTSYDTAGAIIAMVSKLSQGPTEGLGLLTKLVTSILDRQTGLPTLAGKFWPHFWLVTQVSSILQIGVPPELAQDKESLTTQLRDHFSAIDSRLQAMVTKQSSGLSLNLCQNLVNGLSSIYPVQASTDTSSFEQLCWQNGISPDRLSTDERYDLVYLSWRFEILNKCIHEGRMEIRVQGVETMQQDLVTYHRRYIDRRPGGSDTAVPMFLSNFLIHHKIVQYLLSAESHPQLISRSANILGFLVVTGKLTDEYVDVIWNAFVSSQGSRSSETTMTMLNTCTELCDVAILLQFIDRMTTIPISNFDMQLRNLASHILRSIIYRRQQNQEERTTGPAMAPFDLCLRVAQNSTPDSPAAPENRRALHDWALAHLVQHVRSGSTSEIRETLFRRCLESIAAADQCATGSISALSKLLGDSAVNHFRQMAQEENLITMLVDELQGFLCRVKSEPRDTAAAHECLLYRLNLLACILPTHGVFDTNVAKSLAESLFGAGAIDDIARDAAWNMLNRVTRTSKLPNSFLDFCIYDFFQKLPRQYLVPSCLGFVEVVRQYVLQTAANSQSDQVSAATITSDLLWYLSLTAPGGKMEMEVKSIDMLIKLYLDSPDAHRRTRKDNDTVHVELVERCILQLTKAASKLRAFSDGTSSGEDEPMVVVVSEDEVAAQEMSFTRSLMILKEFVHGVRSRPMYSPSPEVPTRLPIDFDRLKGQPITIKYQAFAEGQESGSINTFRVGGVETVQELRDRLSVLTGFSQLMMISNGQKVNLQELAQTSLEDVSFLGRGLLLVRKISSGESTSADSALAGLRPMEIEILRHFNDLYSLLNMDEGLAQQVFDFLTAFPPHSSIVEAISSVETSSDEKVPPNAPFKTLYAVYALKTTLSQRQSSSCLPRDFLINGIAALSSALRHFAADTLTNCGEAHMLVLGALTDCLGAFLRAGHDRQHTSDTDGKKSPSTKEATVLLEEDLVHSNDVGPIVRCCFSLLLNTPRAAGNLHVDKIVHGAFSTLLEGAMISSELWGTFQRSHQIQDVLERHLLVEDRTENRSALLKIIKGLIEPGAKPRAPSQEELILELVTSGFDCIQRTPSYPRNTQQLFDAVICLLSFTKTSDQLRLDLDGLAEAWMALIVNHKHREVVGRSEIDFLVLGLSRLILWTFRLAKSSGKQLRLDTHSWKRLFLSQLFPDLEDSERIPQLFTSTREDLYSLVLCLTEDEGEFKQLLTIVESLSPTDLDQGQAWSWGIAVMPSDDTSLSEPNWNLERFKLVRDQCGYSGLRNLSNTCYMNSIFTQLFMNVEFRNFMINLNIADGGNSQRLLHETRDLFGYMQDSALKAVDTQNIADSIITYDNTAVDVTHQVDVDEFFNLLFDRWESQILADVDKKAFRSFYGGQLVQQIKSKECSHISERLEPFSAIQCDVVGKSNLFQSLNAYVQGEAMEGDNKYSCTSCGKYVDAIKRACFKELPDNLIFHLKRFDYDMMSDTRIKVNDRFEFPREIDMAPYNIDHLSNPQDQHETDLFTLVGVLVHSGTAESGHYYSYINERPKSDQASEKWVEFNDMDVSEFNLAEIDSQSYGGWQELPGYETRYMKVNNAYMLFYGRVKSASVEEVSVKKPVSAETPRCPLPAALENRIAIDNQTFLRQFCQHDPAHTLFIKMLLRQARVSNHAQCSTGHELEQSVLRIALEHMRSVLTRVKETTLFEDLLYCLTRFIADCKYCCRFVLQWTSLNETPLHDFLLRCPHPKVRKEFASTIILSLRELKHIDMAEAESALDNEETGTPPSDLDRAPFLHALQPLVQRMRDFWESICQFPRAWDDYFGLLTEIASMGSQEAHIVLRYGFLRCCFELLVCDDDHARQLKPIQPYTTYLRMVEKGRKFSYSKIAELIAVLFERVDLSKVTSKLCVERPFDERNMPLTEPEHYWFHFHKAGNKTYCAILDKPLGQAANPSALDKIIKSILLTDPETKCHVMIYGSIKNGISIDPADLAAPYLRAALTLCEFTPAPRLAERIISEIAEEVSTIGISGGKEHLEFFVAARRLRNIRSAPDFFNRCVLRTAAHWAPHLITYWESEVRQRTLNFLNSILLHHNVENMDDEELADQMLLVGKKLCKACASRCQSLLQEGKPVGRTTEELTTVIKVCIDEYFSAEEDVSFVREALDVVERMQALVVTDLDDQVSEWANGSDLQSDSDSEAFGGSP